MRHPSRWRRGAALAAIPLVAALVAGKRPAPVAVAQAAPAAWPAASIAARLGYPPKTKLLIVHGDDAGVTHSVDAAIEAALASGAISSTTILTAAPWFPEIAAFARTHPRYDYGVHLDLTSEWRYLRWRGVSPADTIPSLLDAQGFLWPGVAEVAAHADPAQAERELRAQIERARAFGVPFSHLDTHMAAVLATPALARIYLALGREYHRPVLIRQIEPSDPPAWQRLAPLVAADPNVFLAEVVQLGAGPTTTSLSRYEDAVRRLAPGTLTEIIIHPGFDTAEERAALGNGAYGAAWRQADYDAFTSPAMRQLLRQQGVRLVRWRQVETLLR